MSLEQIVYLAKEKTRDALLELASSIEDMDEEIKSYLEGETTEEKLVEYLAMVRYMIDIGDKYLKHTSFDGRKGDLWDEACEPLKSLKDEIKGEIRTHRREQLQLDTSTENLQTDTKRARLE